MNVLSRNVIDIYLQRLQVLEDIFWETKVARGRWDRCSWCEESSPCPPPSPCSWSCRCPCCRWRWWSWDRTDHGWDIGQLWNKQNDKIQMITSPDNVTDGKTFPMSLIGAWPESVQSINPDPDDCVSMAVFYKHKHGRMDGIIINKTTRGWLLCNMTHEHMIMATKIIV